MSSDDNLREAIDRARSGAPAAGEAVRDRFSADEIFQRIVASADSEMESGGRELFFSGLAAGFAITLTFLAHAVFTAAFHTPALNAILYPIGFIYIILGRYQLYTENTLPPVTLVLTRLASIPLLLEVWTIVLLGNVLGAAVGVVVLAYTSVLSPEAAHAGAEFATKGIQLGWWDVFFKAIFAGWIVAGVVWLDHAARDTITRLVLIYIAFYTISAVDLYHVVVTACDALYLVLVSKTGLIPVFVDFWLPVLLGNTIGGVFLVALVNYAQTSKRRFPEYETRGPELNLSEWIFGHHAGRQRAAKKPNETDENSEE